MSTCMSHSCSMNKEPQEQKRGQLTPPVCDACVGGMWLKHHKNLLWSLPPLCIPLRIANTCHQLLIRVRASTLLYSTLGNAETHPTLRLLKQRLQVQDNGSRAGAPVFLGKGPRLDGRDGGHGISDTFSKAKVSSRGVKTVCFVCTLSFWGGKPFPCQRTGSLTTSLSSPYQEGL